MRLRARYAATLVAAILPFTASADEETKVNAVVAALSAAIEAGDIDTAKRLYAPDAAVLFDPEVPVRGTGPIGAAFTEFSALAPVLAYPRGEQVIVVGDLALHIAPWTMSGTAPDGTAVEGGGLSVAVLRRDGDGTWRIVIDNPNGETLLK